MNEILDLELLKQFDPIVTRPGYYQFSVKQFTVGPPVEPEDYKVLVFGFKQSTTYRDWSVELAITKEKDNKEIWHGSIIPLRQELWDRRLPSIAVDLVRALPHAYNSAREKAEQVEAEETLEIHTLRESLDTETWPIETQREVVAGFAVKNGYTHLFGDAGVGKSILAHNIGLHAASGLHYLGFNAFLPPIKVLYLSLEMFYDEFRDRSNMLGQHFPEVVKENFKFICPEAFDITSPRDRFLLGNTVAKHGINLTIIDSHTDWRGEVDTNNNAEVGSKIILPAIELMKQLDFSIILLDHIPWVGARPAGAKVVWNKASIGIFMEETGEENVTKISFRKWRNTARRKPRPILLRYSPETYLIAATTVADLSDICDRLTLPDTPSGVDRQIIGLTGLKERQARQKKTDAIRAGFLQRKKGMIHLGQVVAGVDLSRAEPIDKRDI